MDKFIKFKIKEVLWNIFIVLNTPSQMYVYNFLCMNKKKNILRLFKYNVHDKYIKF